MKSDDKRTREKLIKAAKEEFLEKGYTNSSLRNICKNAGVTTGALYFFFQDKNDLFAALVKQPLDQVLFIMKAHYQNETDMAQQKIEHMTDYGSSADFEDDFIQANALVDVIFDNYDAFYLLVAKSYGSQFENYQDAFVELSEIHYRFLANKMEMMYQGTHVEDVTLHWFAHMQVDMFVQIVTHHLTREQAKKQIIQVLRFFIGGWFALFKNQIDLRMI